MPRVTTAVAKEGERLLRSAENRRAIGGLAGDGDERGLRLRSGLSDELHGHLTLTGEHTRSDHANAIGQTIHHEIEFAFVATAGGVDEVHIHRPAAALRHGDAGEAWALDHVNDAGLRWQFQQKVKPVILLDDSNAALAFVRDVIIAAGDDFAAGVLFRVLHRGDHFTRRRHGIECSAGVDDQLRVWHDGGRQTRSWWKIKINLARLFALAAEQLAQHLGRVILNFGLLRLARFLNDFWLSRSSFT